MLLSLALALALAMCEIALRWSYPEFGTPVTKIELLTQHDPLLGWSKKPSFTGVLSTDEYEVVEVTNSKGLRGPEYDYSKGNDEYRILVLGDSFTEGYSVDFGELATEVLKRNLNDASGRPFEVINAGTGGYSTDQELLFFQHEGKRYDPDLTILMFYRNDLKYNLEDHYWRGRKPLFALTDGRPELVSIPGALDEESRRELAEETTVAFSPLDPETWYVKRFLAYVLPLIVDRNQDEERQAVDGDFDRYARPRRGSRKRTEQWEMTEALIGRLEEETAAAGSRLLIFYVPEKSAVYRSAFTVSHRKDHLGAALGLIAERSRIPWIDPLPSFRERASRLAATGESLYYRQEWHWNAAGHHLAGTLIASHLRDNCALYEMCETQGIRDAGRSNSTPDPATSRLP